MIESDHLPIGLPRQARRHALHDLPAHVTACLRLRPGQCRARYAGAASMARPQEHPAHGALHRAVARQVQELLAHLGSKEACSASLTVHISFSPVFRRRNRQGRPQACCGVVSNGCCDVSARLRPANLRCDTASREDGTGNNSQNDPPGRNASTAQDRPTREPRCCGTASQVKSSQVKSSQVKSSQVKSSQVKSSQVKSSEVQSSQVKSSQVKSSQVKSSQVKSSQVKSSQVLVGPALFRVAHCCCRGRKGKKQNRRQHINAINGDRVIDFAFRSLEANFGIQVPPIFNVCPHSTHRVFPRINIDDALAKLADGRARSAAERRAKRASN